MTFISPEEGIQLVKQHTKQIWEYAQRTQGEQLLVVFHNGELNSIETFKEGTDRMDNDQLGLPLDRLKKGMDDAESECGERAIVLTFITVNDADDTPDEEYFVACGVMSCEAHLLVHDNLPRINSATRGQA